MKLRYRFTLVIFGIILFSLATPVLVLYARGFQWDWKNHSFVKTGTLVVKTEPAKADVFLNDLKQESTTPLNVRFLTPGDYDVRLEKDGYATWTKRLSVKSQLVTWANESRDFVALFLSKPKLEQTWDATQVILSDLKDKINFANAKQFSEINVQNGNVSNIEKLPVPIVPPTAIEIRNTVKALGVTLPEFTNGQIVPANNQFFLILDQTLYLVNDKLEKIYSPVSFADYNTSSSELLFSNDNEIYVYQPNAKNSELIYRSVTPLKNPMINATTGFIFFQNENLIKAIELDDRGHRNLFTISAAKDNFILSMDGKKLYTFSQTEINEYLIR